MCSPVFVARADYLKVGFFQFSQFLHIKGRNFPFFPFTSAYDPYEPWKVSWKSVCTFLRNPEHRQTHAHTQQLYIYRSALWLLLVSKWLEWIIGMDYSIGIVGKFSGLITSKGPTKDGCKIFWTYISGSITNVLCTVSSKLSIFALKQKITPYLFMSLKKTNNLALHRGWQMRNTGPMVMQCLELTPTLIWAWQMIRLLKVYQLSSTNNK